MKQNVMKLFVGVTDNEWFNFLASIHPDEVNFWKPGGQLGFAALAPGAPFLFKLKYPVNKIAGFGYFVRFEKLPLSLAWDAFGNKNGATDFFTLRDKINSLRDEPSEDPTIGCIILNDPVYFPKEQWIDAPVSFAPNIVTGMGFDMTEGEGALLWNQISERLTPFRKAVADDFFPGYGKGYLVKNRLGQGGFQISVTSAYNLNCAISGEKALPVLQAAHIKPFSEQGPNAVSNGLLLRSDLHILFDRGYLTVTPEYRIKVSSKIREKFKNGKHYYAFNGEMLMTLPKNLDERPDTDFIRWHNENIYEKKIVP